MTRWLLAFMGAWVICTSGVYVAWVLGVCIKCIFISGCLGHLGFNEILAAVNGRGVFARGTLLAIAITFIAWAKRR